MRDYYNVTDYSEFPFLEELLKEKLKGKSLDIGCHRGGLMKLAGNSKMLGLDLKKEFLKEGLYPEKTAAGRAATLPFKDASFHSIFSGFTFYYVEDKAAFLHEIGRVLAPGGKVLLAIHHPLDAKAAANKKFIADYVENREAVERGELISREGNEFIGMAWALFKIFNEGKGEGDFFKALQAQYSDSKKALSINPCSSLQELLGFFNKNGFAAESYFALTLDYAFNPEERIFSAEAHFSKPKFHYPSSPLPLLFLYGYSERKMAFFELVKGTEQPELEKTEGIGETVSGHAYSIEWFREQK